VNGAPLNTRADATAAAIRQAEEYLKSRGWRMGDDGKVSKIRGGRGKDLLAECAWEIYQEKPQAKGNTPAVRRRIAKELAHFSTSKNFPRTTMPPFTRQSTPHKTIPEFSFSKLLDHRTTHIRRFSKPTKSKNRLMFRHVMRIYPLIEVVAYGTFRLEATHGCDHKKILEPL
jgi:hypothetical protein